MSIKLFAIILVAVFANALEPHASGATNEAPIYSADPHHLWNRLNEILFQRTAQDGKRYGLDELDILYWSRTTNLLAGSSHQQAVSVLDEFINAHGEKLVRDPLKRAWLQRDLWELFDWTAIPWSTRSFASQRLELQSRLATVIRRLALTTNEIAALPDNYALNRPEQCPDLPRGLFETNGDWITLAPDQNNFQEIAPIHDHGFGGHSAFLVMFRVPQGRAAALAYLVQLQSFEHFWVYGTNNWPFAPTNSPREALMLNSHLPQFPTNTEWALVRKMLVIDTHGRLQPTPITESIQLRRYLGFSSPDMMIVTNRNGLQSVIEIPPQKFFEFDLDRRQNGLLREIGKNDTDFLFVHFMSKGFDPFEASANDSPATDSVMYKSRVLDACQSCHIGPGIYSVNSYAGFLGPHQIEPPQLFNSVASSVTQPVLDWKQQQFNWGLLQGLWNRAD